MVIIVPIYEEEQAGIYYNTAAVIDADGSYLGKYRKTHIPHCKPGFWEKFYFRPGNLGYPVFETALREGRRLHLLRPPFPRRRARPRPERRRDRLQSFGNRCRALRVPVEARAARARGRQRLFRRRHQPRRHRSAVEHRRVLRPELFLRSPRPDHRRSAARQGRSRRRRSRPRLDRRGPIGVAVLSRSTARRLRGARITVTRDEETMAGDLSVTFTGIRFENPFLLASAPPTESESNILQARSKPAGAASSPRRSACTRSPTSPGRRRSSCAITRRRACCR